MPPGCKLSLELLKSVLRLDAELAVAKVRVPGCNLQSEIYNLKSFRGVLAQLVERLNGIEEVTGSNPVGSTASSWGKRRAADFPTRTGFGERLSAMLLSPSARKSDARFGFYAS